MNNYDVFQVAGLSEVEDKTVPSQSDVDDILNHASFGVNEVNSHNLKRVSRECCYTLYQFPI